MRAVVLPPRSRTSWAECHRLEAVGIAEYEQGDCCLMRACCSPSLGLNPEQVVVSVLGRWCLAPQNADALSSGQIIDPNARPSIALRALTCLAPKSRLMLGLKSKTLPSCWYDNAQWLAAARTSRFAGLARVSFRAVSCHALIRAPCGDCCSH